MLFNEIKIFLSEIKSNILNQIQYFQAVQHFLKENYG